jgi:hypothetical protein
MAWSGSAALYVTFRSSLLHLQSADGWRTAQLDRFELGFKMAAVTVAQKQLGVPRSDVPSLFASIPRSSTSEHAGCEHSITTADLRTLLTSEGGVDLERIVEAGTQVAMRIVGVVPGTTAARLGARNGDTIESINEMPLVSIAAAYQAGDAAAKQDRIVIKGKRGGEPYITILTMTR